MSGEEKAWDILAGLDPEDACKRALVSYDKGAGYYIIRSLGADFEVLPEKRQIKGLSPGADALVKKSGYFLNHSLLWYLINAKDIPLSGRLLKPEDVKGGLQFFRGTHVLPLERLSGLYGDKAAFIEKGISLGGRLVSYGDASLELYPLPRAPVTLILWLADEEFPARASLLLDSTVEMHLPLDIVWSVGMLSALAMM